MKIFPTYDQSIIKGMGIDGELLLELTDDDLIKDLNLNNIQIKVLKKTIDKLK